MDRITAFKISRVIYQVLLMIGSALIGYILCQYLDNLKISYLFYATLVSVVVLTLLYITITFDLATKEGKENVKNIGNKVNDIKSFISDITGQKVRICKANDAYKEMALAVSQAKKSVTVMVRHHYNKKEKRENAPVDELNTSSRNLYYSSLVGAIQNKNIHYNRIIQVDPEFVECWQTPISSSRLICEEILISLIEGCNSIARANIYVIPPKLEMSFVIIDDATMFFNVFSLKSGEYSNPYTFHVQSAESDFSFLNDIIESYVENVKPIDADSAQILNTILKN